MDAEGGVVGEQDAELVGCTDGTVEAEKADVALGIV